MHLYVTLQIRIQRNTALFGHERLVGRALALIHHIRGNK